MNQSSAGKWDYSKVEAPYRYGADDETYKLGMNFLTGCSIIEDWGCGLAWAKQFAPFGSLYRGIDGSPSKWVDQVADLAAYRSDVEGIFMRHVLEHNLCWATILDNALASFKKRMALIFYMPWLPETKIDHDRGGFVEISFAQKDIRARFHDARVLNCPSIGLYSGETIFYLSKE